jgi:hypothetical protein
MRTLALAVAAAATLAGCAPEKPGLLDYPDFRGLYDASGADVSCPGATRIDAQATFTECEWTCLLVDGKDVSRVRADFKRESTAAPWAVDIIMFEYGLCE